MNEWKVQQKFKPNFRLRINSSWVSVLLGKKWLTQHSLSCSAVSNGSTIEKRGIFMSPVLLINTKILGTCVCNDSFSLYCLVVPSEIVILGLFYFLQVINMVWKWDLLIMSLMTSSLKSWLSRLSFLKVSSKFSGSYLISYHIDELL